MIITREMCKQEPKKEIKTVKDLIDELQKYPMDTEITIRCEEFRCCGHDKDEYCYCSNESVDKEVDYVTPEFDKHNEPKNITQIVIQTSSY